MELTNELKNTHHQVDILAKDRDGKTILLVEIKAQKLELAHRERLLLYVQQSNLQYFNDEVPYLMIVDSETISIFRQNNQNRVISICELSTVDTLSYYEPKLSQRRIFGVYLTALIEAWLRDIAYNWKSEYPPAYQKIAEINLLSQLAGGSTVEVE